MKKMKQLAGALSFCFPSRRGGRRIAALVAIAATALSGPVSVASAKSLSTLPVVENCDCDVVVIHVGKAYPINLMRPTRDVLISDPNIVDVVLRTSQQSVLFGQRIGQANILFFDENNRQIRAVEVRVEYDSETLNHLIRRQFPRAQVRAESSLGEIVLTGTVKSSVDSTAIEDLAKRFVAAARASRAGDSAAPKVDDDASGVVNRISILNDEQIHLQVRVAEVNRSILKEFGLDWNAGLQSASISSIFGLKSGNIKNFLNAQSSQIAFGPQTISSFIKALEQYSLVSTLAEPSLTAVSGESASFLAGGEFPIPVPGEGGPTIQFKQFGVGLDFTPVVIGDGRINLQIATEVSALTDAGSVIVNGFNIPGLTVRRADTTVEVNSGGTIMIAGLIQQNTRRLSAGLPGIRSLPVLGQFFRNENTKIDETELVVLVTPYSVRPGSPEEFVLPTDGFAPASDLDIFLFGRLHSIYGVEPEETETVRANVEKIHTPVGYIME